MITNIQNIFVMFVTQCLVIVLAVPNSFAAPHKTIQVPSGLFNKYQDHSKYISQNLKWLSKNKLSKNNHLGHGKQSNSRKMDHQESQWKNKNQESSNEHRGKDHKQNHGRQQHHRKNGNPKKHNNHNQETHHSHRMNQQEKNGAHYSRHSDKQQNTLRHLEAHHSKTDNAHNQKKSHRHNSKPQPEVKHHTHNQPRHKPHKRTYYRHSPWYNTRYLAPINYHYHPIGYRVRYLPEFHVSLVIAGVSYFYYEGVFYRPFGTNYIVVSAPMSALVQTLPAGFIAFPIGNRIYYYVNDTYYVWHETQQGYFVIEKPDGADRAMSEAIQGRIYAYPNKDQSEEQQAKDRYECHRWGSIESGVDPTHEDAELSAEEKAVYLTAMGACLKSRGYKIK